MIEKLLPPLTPSTQIDLWNTNDNMKVKRLNEGGFEVSIDGATFICQDIARIPVDADGLLDASNCFTLINVTGGTLPKDQPGYLTLANLYMQRVGFESSRIRVRKELEQRLDKWRGYGSIDMVSLDAMLDEILPLRN